MDIGLIDPAESVGVHLIKYSFSVLSAVIVIVETFEVIELLENVSPFDGVAA